ncbi:MAG: hypothetical protein JSV56_00390 [Methanomassiliicoccales archaeon]|nr:MAG: hypothetical protein JSV56_00390 [Methanomassiliicoccales archaeon]
MKRIYLCVILILTILIFNSNVVLGHVPLDTKKNTSLDTAMHIHDPQKSWAIYDDLHSKNEAKYYELHLEKGDRLYASILTPEDGPFAPKLIIMGPGLGTNDSYPDHIEVPEGVDILVIEEDKEEEAEYEPFTPASNYALASFDNKVNATGTYYIVVFDELSGGKFTLAVGYQESFTLFEWLKVPVDLIGIYLWSGHGPLLIIAPFLFWIIAGYFVLYWRYRVYSINSWLAATGGLLYLGTATLISIEMAIALNRAPLTALVVVTLIFILIPAILGIMILLKIIVKKDEFERKDKVVLAIYGVLGLVFWGGVIFGPIVILIASVFPVYFIFKKENGKKDEKID